MDGQLRSERLARQMAEENIGTLDKEKAVLKAELMQIVQRHEKEIAAKNTSMNHVRACKNLSTLILSTFPSFRFPYSHTKHLKNTAIQTHNTST